MITNNTKMPNFLKQQNGSMLIGMLIAIAIIAILFVHTSSTFFSGGNITEKKAIYEEAKKDIVDIEQINQQSNDIRKEMMKDSEDIGQMINEKNEIINKK